MWAFIRKQPVVVYVGLTFALSWGGLLWLSGGAGGIPAAPEDVERLLPLFILCVLVGPSVAGVFLTGIIDGRAGLRDLSSRLLKWRLAARWYAAALLTAPVVMMGILLALSLFSERFVPAVIAADDKATILLAGFATALGAGIFEELGWTGFAVPRLRRRGGALATGLVVGVVWAIWHLLPVYWMSGTVSGTLALPSYLLDPFLFLVAFRVLMVWVYDRTESLLLAMLMHASLTFGARVFTPQGISGVPLITFDLLWAATISLIIAAITVADGRKRPFAA